DYRSVLWDEKEIHYTDEWKKTFVERLGKSNLFIPLISASTLATFGNTGAADNVLLECDIAVDRFQKKELLILPLFILESGQKTFDFNSVSSHDKVCKGCNRSFKDIWDVFQGIKGFFINFDNDKDLRLLELEIMNMYHSKGLPFRLQIPQTRRIFPILFIYHDTSSVGMTTLRNYAIFCRTSTNVGRFLSTEDLEWGKPPWRGNLLRDLICLDIRTFCGSV
ncbi:hypothetical protein HK098_008394, partial [Nowakowskiella sp. JEL0407]